MKMLAHATALLAGVLAAGAVFAETLTITGATVHTVGPAGKIENAMFIDGAGGCDLEDAGADCKRLCAACTSQR